MTNPARQPPDRLDDLETVLKWEGQVDNARIRSLFGVQTVWASRLLAELIERMGARAYRPRKHGPLMVCDQTAAKRASPEGYLRLLSSAPGGLGAPASLVHDLRVDLTSVSPAIFASIRRASEQQVGLEITYRSMSTPLGASRLVFPHSIVRAPRRWHMRAWCTKRQDFLDFVLARIQTARVIDVAAAMKVDADTAWNHLVDLVLVPHPDLSENQQELISAEYFPGAKARQLRVREALAGYIIQDLRIAIDARTQKPPEYQLLLAPGSTSSAFRAESE